MKGWVCTDSLAPPCTRLGRDMTLASAPARAFSSNLRLQQDKPLVGHWEQKGEKGDPMQAKGQVHASCEQSSILPLFRTRAMQTPGPQDQGTVLPEMF